MATGLGPLLAFEVTPDHAEAADRREATVAAVAGVAAEASGAVVIVDWSKLATA
jgi:hypothetical protein